MTKEEDTVLETRPRRPILSLKLRPKPELIAPVQPAKVEKPAATPAPAAAASSQPISPKQFHKTLNAINPVVRKALADETWKDESLLEAYQAAKAHADSTMRKSAKIISRAAVQRGDTAGASTQVTEAALRAAYAAAIVALVRDTASKDGQEN